MTPVILESPYAGDTPLHLRYLRAAIRDSLLRGEAPYASHHLYTAPGVLRDDLPEEREAGIVAGFAWRALASKTVFYVDYGWSIGMVRAREHASRINQPYEMRVLEAGWLYRQLEREAAGTALGFWLKSMGEDR